MSCVIDKDQQPKLWILCNDYTNAKQEHLGPSILHLQEWIRYNGTVKPWQYTSIRQEHTQGNRTLLGKDCRLPQQMRIADATLAKRRGKIARALLQSRLLKHKEEEGHTDGISCGVGHWEVPLMHNK